MNILKTLLLSLCIVLVSSSFAQEENTVLWKISGNGLESPSYLFGTIHLICPDDFELSDKTKKALDETEQLILELDMDDPDFVTKTQKLSVNPGMKNISDDMSEEDQAVLNKFYKEHYGTDLSQLGILKPFTLLSMMMIKVVNCTEPASYETELMAIAKRNELEIKGLETLEEQFAIFDKVPEEEQIAWLLDYANNENELRRDIDKLVKVYKTGNITAMLELMADYPEYKKIEDELLYIRNKKWIASIEANAKETPTFFAVGAAHLASNRGVIELLRKQGYKVSPVL
jgi:uncharacterized protein YbaP (TraB family)